MTEIDELLLRQRQQQSAGCLPAAGSARSQQAGSLLLSRETRRRVHRRASLLLGTTTSSVGAVRRSDDRSPRRSDNRGDGSQQSPAQRVPMHRDVVACSESETSQKGCSCFRPSMNEGPLSSPLVLRRDGACVREVVARRHGCRRSPGRTGCRRILWAAGGVAGWSGAHLSIASSTSRTRCDRCSLRRRNSKMDCHAVRAKMAPAGAKGLNGWLRVSMYQIASVSLRASSICATFAPR